MPQMPQTRFPVQTKIMYKVISEFFNVINFEKIPDFEEFFLAPDLPVICSLFLGRFFYFFFYKTRLIRIRLSEEISTNISFFSLSNTGIKVSFLNKDETVTIIQLLDKKTRRFSFDTNSFCFEEYFTVKPNIHQLVNMTSMCFDKSELYLGLSSQNGKILIVDIKNKNISVIISNVFLTNLTFSNTSSPLLKFFGKNSSGSLVEYDVKKKKLEIHLKGQHFILKKNYYIIQYFSKVSFFCYCHGKLIAQYLIPFEIEKFLMVCENGIFTDDKNSKIMLELCSGSIKNCCVHRYIHDKGLPFFEKFSGLKAFKNKNLNFYIANLYQKRDLHYSKPLSEKHHTFTDYKVISCFNNRINDIKFFGQRTSVAVVTNNNSINIFSGPTFKLFGKLVFGKVSFLSIQIRGLILIGLNGVGQLCFWNLSLYNLIEWFQIHHISTGLFNLSKYLNREGVVISGGKNNIIKIWKIEQLKFSEIKIRLLVSKGFHKGKISMVSISHDEEMVATASTKKEIFIWKPSFPYSFRQLKKQKKSAWALDFHPGERILAAGLGDGTIILFNVINGICVKKFESDGFPVYNCFFSSNGSQLFSTTSEGKIKIWKIDKGECVNTIRNHTSFIWAFDISFSEDYLISGCEDGKLVLLKDFGKKNCTQKLFNFSCYLNLQKKLSDKKPDENLKAVFQKFLDYRDPVLLLDLIKFFSEINQKRVKQILSELVTTLDFPLLKFLFRSMTIWITVKNGMLWVQNLLSLLFKKTKIRLLNKIKNTCIEVLIIAIQNWVNKLREVAIQSL